MLVKVISYSNHRGTKHSSTVFYWCWLQDLWQNLQLFEDVRNKVNHLHRVTM